MKVIIAGSRSITDFFLLVRVVADSGFNITSVVCGMAEGVDLMGKEWATINGVHVIEKPALWRPPPKGILNPHAGKERNREMANIADALIALWNGSSPGTDHMIRMMKHLKKPHYVHRTDEVRDKGLFGLF